MKYNYKTQLGANKGRTTRSLARSSAISSAVQGINRSNQQGQTERRKLDWNEATKLYEKHINQTVGTNKPTGNGNSGSNSSSSNIIDWIN